MYIYCVKRWTRWKKTGKKISHVTGVLARSVRIIIENILREGGALQEIRMRIGQPLTVMIDGEEQILPLKRKSTYCYKGRNKRDDRIYEQILFICI